MSARNIEFCRHCALSLVVKDSRTRFHKPLTGKSILQSTAPFFFSKRWLAIRRPVIPQLEAPDPSSPMSSVTNPVKRDPGLTLGEHGIPVPPSAQSRRGDFTDERSWAETVYRTLSGGMKSDYLKCILKARWS